jgi:mycoredoxin
MAMAEWGNLTVLYCPLSRPIVNCENPHGKPVSNACRPNLGSLSGFQGKVCMMVCWRGRALHVGRCGSLAMELVVYSSFWCPDCREAKRFLDKHNIPYREVDIETTPGAADEVVRQTGKRAIPQFVIDGEWVQPYRPGEGFLYEEMARRLGIAQP